MKLLMSTQFKKDLKRYQNKPGKIAALKVVLNSLSETGIIPDSYYPHPLHGDFKGYMECHVEGPKNPPHHYLFGINPLAQPLHLCNVPAAVGSLLYVRPPYRRAPNYKL